MRLLTVLLAAALALPAATSSPRLAPDAPPLRLGTSGRAFTVDGTARFLTFASYFDALDARSLDADLDYLAARVDGVRIFANWWDYDSSNACRLKFSPGTVITATDGRATVRPERLAKLKGVLDAARARGLLVDLTFAAEPVEGLSTLRADATGHVCPPADFVNRVQWAEYSRAVAQVAGALRSPAYLHVMFDLQNEAGHRLNGARDDDIAVLAAAVRAADPDRLLSVSRFEPDADKQAKLVANLRLSYLNFHDWPRGPGWGKRTAAQVVKFLDALARAHISVPVYAGEPDPEPHGRGIDEFRDSVLGARRAGAGAWTLHTRAAHDLATRGLLDALDPDTRRALDALPGLVRKPAPASRSSGALGVD